jgi:hemerythrin superfamily protein
MPTTASTGKRAATGKASKAATGGSRGKKTDAINMLKSDHRAVEKLFSAFESAKDDARKQTLANQICAALKVHTQIEEEIFYPATREALTDKQEEMVDEAVVEHAGAKQLIAEIEKMRVGDDLFDAKVKVLSEQIEHHVGEEEKEMFPAVSKKDLDLDALGKRMAARKAELEGQMAAPGGKAMQ